MPGTADGTVAFRHFTVSSATCSRARLLGALLAGDDHVRLEDHALERDARVVELAEHRALRPLGDLVAALDGVAGVRAVHQHLRLDDRHDAGFLAQRRIAGERVRVGLDAVPRRQAVGDGDDGAPLGEAGAELVVLGQALAQAVEPFGDRLDLGVRAGERLGAGVDLDAGDRARPPS